MKVTDDERMTRQAVTVAIVLMALVMLMDIVQFSLDDRLAAPEPVVTSDPMTPYEQCQIWNKQAEWPRYGGCPGDLQGRVWR